MKRPPGFTLVELLVVLAIMAILAAIAFGVFQNVSRKGDEVAGLSNMRQIGLAIQEYANDHYGTLPGPLKPHQVPEYDPSDSARLATTVGEYLGVKDPDEAEVLDVFISPAFRKAMAGTADEDLVPYFINMAAEDGDTKLAPFGDAKEGKPANRLVKVPGRAWAFMETDQENPFVSGKGWASNTPEESLYRNRRLVWFFDGSAEAIDMDAFIEEYGGPKGSN